MAGQPRYPNLEALRKLEACLHDRLVPSAFACIKEEPHDQGARLTLWRSTLCRSLAAALDRVRRLSALLPQPGLRRWAAVAGSIGCVSLLATVTLWWRLSNGPIALDIATPWLAVAIAENFGESHQVEIGGTQIERDETGRASLRIRDIVVRDPDGTVVASAPKAEVGLSTWSLLLGRVRAERLSLVGAEMAVRIGPDGKLTVFAGTNRRPFVTASAGSISVVTRSTAVVASAAAPTVAASAASPRSGAPDLAALLAWIESLDASGLDGGELSEIGLKGGSLTVDDERNGKQWVFADINLSVTRPSAGGVAVTLGSDHAPRPWLIRATMAPAAKGHRLIDFESQSVSAKDLMLALRIGENLFDPDLPLSGRIRAELGPDGLPRMLDGRLQIDGGTIVALDDPTLRIPIDHAELGIEWNAPRRVFLMPFQIVSGGNRITLLAQVEPPAAPTGAWALKVSGGSVVLAAAHPLEAEPLVLNRFLLNLRIDSHKQQIEITPSEVGNGDIGVSISGNIDYSGDDPRVMIGIAGTNMPVSAMKRLWPICAAPKVRAWVQEHVLNGTVERLVIATNTPWSTLKPTGPPIPDEGLSVEIAGHSAEVRPVEGLPSIRDADLNVQISGRTAAVNLGRGNIELSPGRKLAITNGLFEVPDTFPTAPPAKARFRLDGSVPAAAELLGLERLREHAGLSLDPATSRGTLAAQVMVSLPLRTDLTPGSSSYTVNVDLANFAAERMVMGRKLEAAALKVSANNNGHWIRGDVKLNGIPVALDYRKPRDGDADVRIQATLDESARGKLGFDLGSALTGPVPVKLSGRMPAGDGEGRFAVEADLTPARIENLLPGWSKTPGEASRAAFILINRTQGTRLEDLVIEAPNASVKGMIEIDSSGQVSSANFPMFNISSRDRATLKAESGVDGILHVVLRGDVYDGRTFVKSAMAGPTDRKLRSDTDVDLDVKLGTVLGFHGETLRGLDLRVSRRAGTITALSLNAKLGRDTPLVGDLRGRGPNGRQMVFLETNDAGAFFRFSDVYAKIVGGEMWVALDPLSTEQAPQEGILNVRDFTVRGEPALDRVAGTPPSTGSQGGVEFSRLRVEFARSFGRFSIRDGLVKGPVIGATVEGNIDYQYDEVHMRGTFVPLYGLNNMFGQIPIFGQLLGGSNEGLLGVTYEVVGPAGAPTLRVNPISAVAPGLLRKFFEFPSGNGTAVQQNYADPGRPN